MSRNPLLHTLALAATLASASAVQGAPAPETTFHYVTVDGVRIFYREAGDKHAPTLLLLHGFPSSSFMYRQLIPKLAANYHVVAPDYPGFGFSDSPSRDRYTYTFAHLATTLEHFTDAVGLERYALQVFDYGAPVGWRMAVDRPERVTAIISQNGNAYEEGFSPFWDPIKQYWQAPTEQHRTALLDAFKPEAIKWQYTQGVKNPDAVAPETYTLDAALIARPGNLDIQLDLIGDYANNARQYPLYHRYFREHRPPLLAVWGKNDPIFQPAGATAFKQDLPDASVHFYDTGHFALETHVDEIAAEILRFLDGAVKR